MSKYCLMNRIQDIKYEKMLESNRFKGCPEVGEEELSDPAQKIEDPVEEDFNENTSCNDEPYCDIEFQCPTQKEVIESRKQMQIMEKEKLIKEMFDFYKKYPCFSYRVLEDGSLNPLMTAEIYHYDLFSVSENPFENFYKLQSELSTNYLRTGKGKEILGRMHNAGEIEKFMQRWYIAHPNIPYKGGLEGFIESIENNAVNKFKESIKAKKYDPNDESGNTESNITNFLEKYSDGNDTIQELRKDVMKLISDIQWIKESGNENEQFALDFVDAVNEASVMI